MLLLSDALCFLYVEYTVTRLRCLKRYQYVEVVLAKYGWEAKTCSLSYTTPQIVANVQKLDVV